MGFHQECNQRNFALWQHMLTAKANNDYKKICILGIRRVGRDMASGSVRMKLIHVKVTTWNSICSETALQRFARQQLDHMVWMKVGDVLGPNSHTMTGGVTWQWRPSMGGRSEVTGMGRRCSHVTVTTPTKIWRFPIVCFGNVCAIKDLSWFDPVTFLTKL